MDQRLARAFRDTDPTTTPTEKAAAALAGDLAEAAAGAAAGAAAWMRGVFGVPPLSPEAAAQSSADRDAFEGFSHFLTPAVATNLALPYEAAVGRSRNDTADAKVGPIFGCAGAFARCVPHFPLRFCACFGR
jgi:hypothetical protein